LLNIKHKAAEKGNLNVVDLLLQRGADLNLKTNWGALPADVVCISLFADRRHQREIIEKLNRKNYVSFIFY